MFCTLVGFSRWPATAAELVSTLPMPRLRLFTKAVFIPGCSISAEKTTSALQASIMLSPTLSKQQRYPWQLEIDQKG